MCRTIFRQCRLKFVRIITSGVELAILRGEKDNFQKRIKKEKFFKNHREKENDIDWDLIEIFCSITNHKNSYLSFLIFCRFRFVQIMTSRVRKGTKQRFKVLELSEWKTTFELFISLNNIKGIIHKINIDANIIKLCHAVTFLS